MTEPQNENTPVEAAPEAATEVPAPVADAVTEAPAPAPVADAVAEAAPVKPARTVNRKKAAVIAAGVAVAVLAGGAVAASAAIADADRTSPTRYWTAAGGHAAQPDKPAVVPANELSGKLLPVPTTFTLGPDLADDGNNFFVSGESAVEGFKDARKGLSSTERKQRDEALAELKLKGLAGRSYTKGGGQMVLEVRIMQADPQSLGKFAEVTKKLIEFMGEGRDAPKVDGFPDAKCSVTGLGKKDNETIDSLDCVAVEGDVMVNFRAYGPKPFSTSDATQFFKNQLTHLKSPGESV
ncbi:hypothetical protein ACFWBF_06680 [Streptomyces sp. NPDC060028]|uniref:hypothetical protein n=1 Tax=Streptomyces sp. NPDC060028 TaxID=3347041 RepID=UPI0036BD1B1C